jgi:hypothetical protein
MNNKKRQKDPIVSKLQQDIAKVYQTVYTGNGKPSIINHLSQIDAKLTSLESEMDLKFKHITEVVTERFNNISSQITREFDEKTLHTSGMWNFKIAITTSVIAAATSVFVVLLKELVVSFH